MNPNDTVSLLDMLKAEGFDLPEDCRDVRLIMQHDAPMLLQLDVLLKPDTAGKVGRALAKLAAATHEFYEARRAEREAVAGR